MTDTWKAKSTLREQASLLEDPNQTELFGKPFRKHVTDGAKVKKESNEVYSSVRNDSKRPFRKGPSFQ